MVRIPRKEYCHLVSKTNTQEDHKMDTSVESKASDYGSQPPNDVNEKGDVVELGERYTPEEERQLVRKIDMVVLPMVNNSSPLGLCSND